jgi:GTP pyrophosphokinase
MGMLEDLTKVLTRELSINIRGLNISAHHDVFHCDLTVQVDSTATVDLICASLKRIDGVKFAKRIS